MTANPVIMKRVKIFNIINCWAIALRVMEALGKTHGGLVREQLQATFSYFYMLSAFSTSGMAESPTHRPHFVPSWWRVNSTTDIARASLCRAKFVITLIILVVCRLESKGKYEVVQKWRKGSMYSLTSTVVPQYRFDMKLSGHRPQWWRWKYLSLPFPGVEPWSSSLLPVTVLTYPGSLARCMPLRFVIE